MIGFLVFFAFVFVVVLACTSNKKRTRVTREDPATGKTIVEIHEVDTPSAGQTAARATLGLIVVIVVVLLVGLVDR